MALPTSVPISPAPITRIVRSLKSPSTASASSTAAEPMDTGPRLMAVSSRARVPARIALSTTAESAGPAAPRWPP